MRTSFRCLIPGLTPTEWTGFRAIKLVDVGILLWDALFPFALCFYPIRIWVCWFRSDIKFVEPKWRSRITVFGFATSNISLLILIATMLYGLIGSGLQANGPTAAHAELILLTTSLLAIIAALVGTGPLGFPTAACSVLCLLTLFIHGLAS